MSSNIVIMTTGLAGSSVLAGLFARAGLWPGHETCKKHDYDTFENRRLVELNQQIFTATGFDGAYTEVYDPNFVDFIERRADAIDPAPFRDFLAECDLHAPWVWKDPRLWLTLPVWARWTDFSNVRFVHLTREVDQAWISITIRRQIQTPDYVRRYIEGIDDWILRCLRSRQLPVHSLTYEELLLAPERVLRDLSEFSGTHLEIEHLRAVHHGELYRRQRGWRDGLKARLIYLKNYGERKR